MKIVFDNIIYSLQKSGGGSVYWTELVKRFVKSDSIRKRRQLYFQQKLLNL